MAKRMVAESGAARAARSWVVVVVLLAMGTAGSLAWRGRRPAAPALPPASAPSSSAETDVDADWCAPGFEPIAGGGCFAPSAAPSVRRPLVLYLHGRYPADAPADESDRQRRLALRATPRGFSVLALRGRLGTCLAPELASWYCWPSNERNQDAAEAFVSMWARALSTARERAGSRATVLLGFSNGGYFAGLIASRGLVEAQAVAVAHGGPVEPVRVRPEAPPMLLLSADDDVAQDDMIRFDEELTRERWPHDSYARFGGHALTDEDIDAALSFFLRSNEPLPLQPPLPMHRPARHDRDGGVGAELEEPPPPTSGDYAAPVEGVPSPSPSSSAETVPAELPSSQSPYEAEGTDAGP